MCKSSRPSYCILVYDSHLLLLYDTEFFFNNFFEKLQFHKTTLQYINVSLLEDPIFPVSQICIFIRPMKERESASLTYNYHNKGYNTTYFHLSIIVNIVTELVADPFVNNRAMDSMTSILFDFSANLFWDIFASELANSPTFTTFNLSIRLHDSIRIIFCLFL